MSNDIFSIPAEEDTPAVVLEKKQGRKSVNINGISMPENVLDFYNPLSEKIFSFFDDDFSGIVVTVHLGYMNSMSNKQLLKLIRNMAARDQALNVVWKYNPKDDLIRSKGEEIRSIFTQLDMKVVPFEG